MKEMDRYSAMRHSVSSISSRTQPKVTVMPAFGTKIHSAARPQTSCWQPETGMKPSVSSCIHSGTGWMSM